MLHPISLADSVLDLDLSVLSVEVEVVETLTNADFVNQDPMIPLAAKLVLPIAKRENLFVRDPVRHNVEDFEPLKYTYIIQSTHIVANFSIICYSQSAAFGSFCEASGGKLASLAVPPRRSPTPFPNYSRMQNVPDLQ